MSVTEQGKVLLLKQNATSTSPSSSKEKIIPMLFRGTSSHPYLGEGTDAFTLTQSPTCLCREKKGNKLTLVLDTGASIYMKASPEDIPPIFPPSPCQMDLPSMVHADLVVQLSRDHCFQYHLLFQHYYASHHPKGI